MFAGVRVLSMKPKITEEEAEKIRQKKARWTEIIQQWDKKTAYTPIPRYTREYAEKMLKKLG